MHTHQAALLPRRVSVCVCVRERGYYNMRNGNNQHTHTLGRASHHAASSSHAIPPSWRRVAFPPAAFLFCLSRSVCVC